MVVYKDKYDRLVKFLIFFLGQEEGKKRARNLMRSSSLKTLIFKYGEEEGKSRYTTSNAKRSHSSTEQGYIERYGEEEGKSRYELRKNKDKIKGTLQGYIERYGEEEGPIKYLEKNKKLSVGYEKLKRDGYSEEEIKNIKTKHSEGSRTSLVAYIKKYGEEEGKLRYEKRQYTKMSHRSWKDVQRYFKCTEEEAKEFVASNQVRDLNFYIKKYGEEEGKFRYEKANIKRAYANTKEYYIEKYGKYIGLLKFKKLIYDRGKANHLYYYIERYGEELGAKKYKNMISGKTKAPLNINSNIQNEFSYNLYNMLDDSLKQCYYGSPISNGFMIYVNPELKYPGKMICPDIRIKNIIIEFDGDYWHSKEEVKIKDAQKDIIYRSLGYYIIRIPEYKYKNNKQETLNECIEIINTHIKEDFKNENYKC